MLFILGIVGQMQEDGTTVIDQIALMRRRHDESGPLAGILDLIPTPSPGHNLQSRCPQGMNQRDSGGCGRDACDDGLKESIANVFGIEEHIRGLR